MLTIIGCGKLGVRIAGRWQGPVRAVTRTETRHAELQDRGLFPTTTVQIDGPCVLCVPSSVQAAVLADLPATMGPAVLVSTTGVYGNQAGSIGADTPPGRTERAQRLAAIEADFTTWAGPLDGRVVRLGGLHDEGYGPAAVFERTGTARLGPPNRVLPLIHLDEAAELVVRALMEPARTWLGVTSQPTREAFYSELAAHTGHPVPTFSEPVAPRRFEP